MTAGVYVKYKEKYAFMIGPNNENTVHGIVRFGGHAFEFETATECAVREVKEETGMDVPLRNSSCTYFIADRDSDPIVVDSANMFDVKPILTVGKSAEEPNSIMFFGDTDESPTPCSETKGIVLLSLEEIITICETDMTLSSFLDSGGRLIERETLDRKLRIVPYFQMRFLYWLITTSHILI